MRASFMDDSDYSLESFVWRVELPHRAKVTEGYYEPGDEDGDREFSNGEILEVRRLICPFVDLTFRHPSNDEESTITVSTRNQDLRFRVLTEKEAHGLATSKIFCDVREVIERWPNAIKSLTDHFVKVPGSESSRITRGEELRLIRVINDGDAAGVRLELKLRSNNTLIQLPAEFAGSFYELEDPKSYSLQELVDVARVERFLRLDLSEVDERPQIRGLPRDFDGLLTMKKPQVLVEIARVLVRETTDEEYTGQPILCPINCDIKLTPREVAYMPLPFENFPLESLGKVCKERLPFVARLVSWNEETAILQNHMTRPGDDLVVYSHTSVDKILAHCGKRYFLIPVYHRGCFKRAGKSKKDQVEVELGSLESKTFPCEVRYSNTSEYHNTIDDHLPLKEKLIFDQFVKAEPCVVVSKLFGDVIGGGYHLPLRTKIAVRMERRWKRSMATPQHMSHLDCCSEEITEELHHEMIRTNKCAVADGKHKKGRQGPAVPPRLATPDQVLADRPQPPLPPTANQRLVHPGGNSDGDDDDSSDDDNDYSYVDVRYVSSTEPESATEEEINKGIIEIPVNGNISGFSVYQMVFFLRENHAPYETLTTWVREGLDGMAFANMTDDDLKTYGIATPVIQFFRDRSKMQRVLSHL